MNKDDFITTISEELAKLGYVRHRTYWYKSLNGILFCIAIISSQWDKNSYYVEIGVDESASLNSYPTLLHWKIRYRCTENGDDKNISPHAMLDAVERLSADMVKYGIETYLCSARYVMLGKQIMLIFLQRND